MYKLFCLVGFDLFGSRCRGRCHGLGQTRVFNVIDTWGVFDIVVCLAYLHEDKTTEGKRYDDEEPRNKDLAKIRGLESGLAGVRGCGGFVLGAFTWTASMPNDTAAPAD